MNKELNVFIDFGTVKYHLGQLVAMPEQHSVAFSYTGPFIDSKLEVSPLNYPLNEKTCITRQHIGEEDPLMGLPGFVADSLPDRWGKMVMDSWFAKKEIINPTNLDRLAYIGRHGIGALQYKPAYEDEKFAEEILKAAALRKSAQRLLKGDISHVAKQLTKLGGSAGGMRPKFVIGFNPEKSLIISGHREEQDYIPSIIKVPTREHEEYQKIEYIYSLMAGEAGINIPETWLVKEKGNDYFIIKRFDRDCEGKKYHVHTLAGLLGIDFGVERISYEMTLSVTMDLTRDVRQLEELFRRMVFNIIGYNCDDHAKNISFLMDSKGNWYLSPAYDMTYSSSLEGLHLMSVNGKVTGHSLKDIANVAEEFEIKNYMEIIEQVSESFQKWRDYGRKYKVSKLYIDKIQQYIDKSVLIS